MTPQAILLPHCLRNLGECEAETTEYGLKCKKCMSCEIGEIVSKIPDSVDVYIVPGTSLAEKILKEKEYEGIVAVACPQELENGKKRISEMDFGIEMEAIPLEETGCQDTVVTPQNVVETVKEFEL